MEIEEESNIMVSILLATYNGGKYLAELIESLLAQTVSDFKLYIQDDKSTDNTVLISSEYAEKYPDKIFFKQNKENTGGAKFNFMHTMVSHKDDYVLLCDQDDIWLPDKIEKSLEKIKKMEVEYSADTPLLVFSNLTVVNDRLEVISASYEKTARKDFTKNSLNVIISMNNAAGCTIMYNRALAELIGAVPDSFVMHDWWVTLIASSLGRVGAIHEPTVLYRQHKSNESGAKSVLSAGYMLHVLTNLKKMASMIDDTYSQAACFAGLFNDKLSVENLELVSAYASIPSLPKLKKLKTIFKYKAFMHGVARKTMQIVILLTISNKVRTGNQK